jgi:hypothetical protein
MMNLKGRALLAPAHNVLWIKFYEVGYERKNGDTYCR